MYILDYDRQLSMIREMTQLRKDAKEWVVYYHHPSTNEMWKSYFPKATPKNRGPKILRTEPVPEKLEERLNECLKSDIVENAIGLGIELSVEPQRWEEIITIVESRYKSYNRKQLSRFLNYLCVENYSSLFEEIGFKPEESGLDIQIFKNLAWRSRVVRFKRFWFF